MLHKEKTVDSKNHTLHAWILAARPKTLSASLAPILVGTSLSMTLVSSIDWSLPFFALIASLFIQIATNLINDALDFKKGSDTNRRLGPTRVTQSGLLSMKQVYWGGLIGFFLALVFSIPLFIKGGTPLMAVLLASVVAGYLYTGGPRPLAYHGLGEIFVIIFYGWVATAALFYLQTGHVNTAALLAGTQVGMLATVMIAINNFRDYAEDTSTNKRTLAVRFGPKFARIEITCMALIPFALNLLWLFYGFEHAALLPLLALPLAINLVMHIWKHNPGLCYNKFLAQGGLLQLGFGFLLSLGFWFASN